MLARSEQDQDHKNIVTVYLHLKVDNKNRMCTSGPKYVADCKNGILGANDMYLVTVYLYIKGDNEKIMYTSGPKMCSGL